jgi:predicted O-methyltransferase YrrM
VYSKVQLAFKYLQYYFSASNGRGHGIHSPFVFEFITKVLNDKTNYPAYDEIEALRKKMLLDKTVLTVEDFGAGSAVNKSNRRTICSIASNAVKSKKYGQLLFRMVKQYEPKTILELGTSLGITTSYLASADPDAKVVTMEGARSVVKKAKDNFDSLKIKNVQAVEGDFEKTLPTVVSGVSAIDFAFFDGNHQKEPTEKYFRQILDKVHNDSILIFDDIHWSNEMEEAWNTIQQEESVRCTIDLFFMGIVFFKQEFKEKQYFKIKF